MVCEFLLTQISSRFSETISGDVKTRGVGEGRLDCNSINASTHSNRRETSAKRGSRGHSLLLDSAMHDAARLLAVEAFVRGSMDNVGVCVVDLLSCMI